MKQFATLAVCLVSIAVLSGCSPKPEDQLVGKWAFQGIDAPASAPKANVDMAKKQLTGSTAQFDKAKAFTLNVGGKPVIQGTWAMTDRQIVITPTSMGGHSMDEIKKQMQDLVTKMPQIAKDPRFKEQMSHATDPLKANLSADGKTFTLTSTQANQGSATFTKAAG